MGNKMAFILLFVMQMSLGCTESRDLVFRVVDEQSGSPMEGVAIQRKVLDWKGVAEAEAVIDKIAHTDSQGTARFEGVLAWKHWFTIEERGYWKVIVSYRQPPKKFSYCARDSVEPEGCEADGQITILMHSKPREQLEGRVP